MDKKQQFLLFVRNLDHAYAQFCIWRLMNNNSEYVDIYNKNLYLCRAIIDSLFFSFCVELAKSLERNRDKNVLSIFYLIEINFFNDKDIDTLNKMKKFRDKILMHADRKVFEDPGKFMKELNLQYVDIEILFSRLIDILDYIKSNYKEITDYKKYFKEVEDKCFEDVQDLMHVFKK